MNTRLSRSARVDDIKSHPQGEIRGLTKLVKITEDARKFAAEQKISEEQTVESVWNRKRASPSRKVMTFTQRRERR